MKNTLRMRIMPVIFGTLTFGKWKNLDLFTSDPEAEIRFIYTVLGIAVYTRKNAQVVTSE